MAVPFVLAAPASAHIAVHSAATTGLTSGRLVGSTAALVTLAGMIIGGLALARSADRPGTGARRNRAVMALAAGVIGLSMGVVNLAVADGGPGTGNGVVAGAMALAFGLIGTVLSGLALTRARRTG
ncbi:DUF6223 family protein [Streptomyces sp. NPDC029041]|uniref:DUF6223 family protein n=1 Tax=Streptomyces sp. NPDC029041 TaxID=3155727 RepID=UPI0033ED159D